MAGVDDYSNWMGNLPEEKHSVPLNTLAIPGSHDSFSCHLDKTGELSPDNEKAIFDLCKIFGNMAKDIIYNWSVTQSKTFTEQLNAGIRYFDMRSTSKPGCEDIVFCHGMYGDKIEDSLREIDQFLIDHPKEVVLLDFNHFYKMNDFHHKQFLSMILEVFGYKMCPFLDVESVTLEMLWENNLQVIIFYKDKIASDYLQFFPTQSIMSPWANTPDCDKLLKFLDDIYSNGHDPEKFWVWQGVCTPDVGTIMRYLTGSLKTDIAKKVAPRFMSWLSDKKTGPTGINICILDFIEMENYVPCVLALNAKCQFAIFTISVVY
ncbi:unnamed protein product [Owenia fusiformis]|uniref:Uncharacterized protein n=1 Tax=Owenia fusiformis TaxID=6347 RepID=A0A8J1T610_OWEFU|nr:unnamed protein product [Owenia fusiformis]